MTEQRIVSMVARAGPWLAPIPTAYAIAAGVVKALDWPLWVALVAGASLECLGVASVYTTLDLWSYNHSKRKSDPSAPAWVAALAVCVYAVAAVTLAVLVDSYIPAVFVLVTLAAALVLGVIADQERRLAEIAAGKVAAARKRAERPRKKAKPNEPPPVVNEPEPVEYEPAFVCTAEGCGWNSLEAESEGRDPQRALAGHMKKHKEKGEQK